MKNVTVTALAFKSLKWDELFDSEEEMLMILLANNFVQRHTVKGYVYLQGFKEYYIKHNTLTEKQMKQLKRLAKNLYYKHKKTYSNGFGHVGSLDAII